jgi:hypothetical protein
MQTVITPIRTNKYYRLYKRHLAKGDTAPKYVIYYAEEYGGDMWREFYSLTEAKRIFNKATKEADYYDGELKYVFAH